MQNFARGSKSEIEAQVATLFEKVGIGESQDQPFEAAPDFAAAASNEVDALFGE